MDLGMQGRVAIVTGGGGPGNGGHISKTLAREGAKVVIVDINEQLAEERAREIRDAGGEAMVAAGDAASWNDAKRAVRTALEAWGRLDILVNSAAGNRGGYFIQTEPEDWPTTINGCLTAALNFSRASLDPMIERRYGRVVNIISDAGRVGEVRAAVYSGAKAGVIGFSRALAKEVGRYGVTVNNVSPGVTEREGTTLAQYWGATPDEQEERRRKALRAYPLGPAYNRFGRPQDIANAVAFFCSDAAEWITGQTISVSGGYSTL